MRLPFAALLLCCSFPLTGGEISPESFLDHVKFLASPELNGRGTGNPGLELAADYIAKEFREAGLQPPVSNEWFQAFSVTTNAELGESNELVWEYEGERESLRLGRGFVPLNFSSGGTYFGQVVFAGYGISAAEYDYDDYAGIDVRDKFVLLLRHEPQEHDEESIFAGSIYTEHSQLFSKAVNAKLHGALGVLMVNDVAQHGGSEGDLTKFEGSVGPGDAGIPFVHVEAAVVREWMRLAGEGLRSIEEEIDADLVPRSFALPANLEVELHADVSREPKSVPNVAGYLPGRTREYVVVGAHYDHLGFGEQFSMAPAMAGTPHPGADDNASGTAGLIELARVLASQPSRERGVLFLAFAGEELGLLGSGHYVNHPILPIEDAVSMVNLDMIGRARDGTVYVGGLDTGSSLSSTLEDLLPADGLQVEYSASTRGYGSSDHTSFTTKQVPVIFFFSGLHSDYHRPSDTWEKINAPDAALILEFVARFVGRLTEGGSRPEFVRAPGILE